MPSARHGEVTLLLAYRTFDRCDPDSFAMLPETAAMRRMYRLRDAA